VSDESKPDIRNGVVDAATRDIEALLKRHLDDVSALIAGFLTDLQERAAAKDFATVRAALSPKRFVEHGRIGESGAGWIGDAETWDKRNLFFVANAGKRIRHIYEIIDEPRDTERPPAFSAEEANTLSPVTTTRDEVEGT
jgi:hypothetical protein